MTELQGQVERITWSDEVSGFTIARIKINGHKEPVTCVGVMVNPLPGEILSMRGEWTSHPRYGRQFRVESCHTAVPATIEGVEKYLGSGLIRGIGPVMSKRIVDRFGLDTLDIIENNIERLTEIQGIGEHRLGVISRAWKDQKEIRSVMIFLQGHGVSSTWATRIFKQYGTESVSIVSSNPYRLAWDITGIGFLTADRIAVNLGFGKESPPRAEAGILHVLNGFAEEGHLCYPEGKLLEAARTILDVGPAIVEGALRALILDQRVILDRVTAGGEPYLYLPYLFQAETEGARRLKALQSSQVGKTASAGNHSLANLAASLSISPAPAQLRAIEQSLSSRVMILTGGPGTGKTTIVRSIIAIREEARSKILLAAPTGRAAKRLEESTGRPAKTIHRLLEFNGRQGGFQKDSENPLDCDLLIVDEASMIDMLLMHHLLKAVPLRASLILVGDINQLPSVGPGNVLRDCIESAVFPVVELTEVFRQARESSIIRNAHRINRGEMPLEDGANHALSDFYCIEQEDPDKAVETIIHLVRERIPARFGLDPLYDVQVLTPMNRGSVGVINLNRKLQEELNPRHDGVTRAGRTFRVSDKVMQVINNYDKDVFNGDIGLVSSISPEEQEVTVAFDDRSVTYDFSELDELTPAYAVTIHKSQGSEYPAVIIPVMTQHYVMLQRNLVYTAVTRGRRLVVIIGTKKALAIAVGNNRTQQRHSLLKQRLA